MSIDSINNTYTVDNGEIKVDIIIAMILLEIKRIHENTYWGSIFIDLPDERRVQCDFAMNTAKLRIEYTLLPSDMDEEQYGIVPNRVINHFYDSKGKTMMGHEPDDYVLSNSLQKFLLDNKYKIAVI